MQIDKIQIMVYNKINGSSIRHRI